MKKTWSKVLATVLVLAMVLCMPGFAASVDTVDYDADHATSADELTDADLPELLSASGNHYPIVMVHGLFGWGQRDKIFSIMPYWGMTTGSLTDYLSAKGYETYAASVGPLSSAWDRACELYAQLAGTRTDYGVKHAQDFGHERYGIDYKQPLFDGWGTERAVNLVGHSFGGATTRLFLEILTNLSLIHI